MKLCEKPLTREAFIGDIYDSLKKNCGAVGSSLTTPYKDRFIYEDAAQMKVQIFSQLYNSSSEIESACIIYVLFVVYRSSQWVQESRS
jgi:hypothetical protein